MLVIESLDHALARGAEPLAELVGYGTTSDAYHIAAAPENGEGYNECMRIAIRAAGVEPDDIGYINAHATSTPLGDVAELTAIRKVYGENSRVSVSSTKSATGHLLGAAGVTGAIFTIAALRRASCRRPSILKRPILPRGDLDLVGANWRDRSPIMQ